MTLAELPLVLMLCGLTAYAVLGGADFGAGLWSLRAGGRRGEALRDHAHHAMGPVWEANHVWLVFVFVICWTAYPTAFGSILSTLAVPFFVAAVGIILRGSAYALRVASGSAGEQRALDIVFALSSIVTPFALGSAIGGIASGRVPVGNAAGDLATSWLNPTSAFVGVLAVVAAGYLAAVYLAADARRMALPELAEAFRTRALAAGVVAGALAAGGLVVVRFDAHPIFTGLTSGAGLAAVLVSAAAGGATMLLVWTRRFGLARVTAAAAVGAIVAGWSLAQRPDILPGLSFDDAAAGRSTLLAVTIAAGIGFLVLAPSLVLLYGLLLRGRFDLEPTQPETARPVAARAAAPRRPRLLPAAAALLVAGAALTVLFDSPLPIALGVVCLLAFAACGFVLLTGPEEMARVSTQSDRPE
jgi:cytochrome bd ubiquinol oxidase subunit II